MATGRTRLQYGCFGCLGAVVLGVAALTAGPEHVEDRVVSREIPVAGGRVLLEIREIVRCAFSPSIPSDDTPGNFSGVIS